MRFFLCVVFIILFQGCMTASDHKRDVQDNSGEKVTVGSVQREIKIGMSGAEVVAALGSPNIVSTDAERREVWVYDKFSSNTSISESGVGLGVIIFGVHSNTGALSKNQKTLTVIINFDKEKNVRDFSYHTSRF